jgi:hypothetical protein
MTTMNKATKNRYLTRTIALLVDTVSETEESHTLLVFNSADALTLTFQTGISYAQNAISLTPWDLRNVDHRELCMGLVLKALDLMVAPAYPTIPVPLNAHEKDLVAGGSVIPAIKAVRERFKGANLSLKDAKDSVDAYRKEIGTYPT